MTSSFAVAAVGEVIGGYDYAIHSSRPERIIPWVADDNASVIDFLHRLESDTPHFDKGTQTPIDILIAISS